MKSKIRVPVFILCLLSVTIFPSQLWAAMDVVTTTTDLAAIVRAVGGDRVKVSAIGKGNEDPHFIEPKPSFMMMLGRAKLLFLIGLELEIWLKPLIEGSRNLAIQQGGPGYVDCSQSVEVKEIPKTRVDPSMGDVHPFGNPHYWLDPENGVKIAELVARKLAEVDPAGQAIFQKNLESFRSEISGKIPGWKTKFAAFKNKSIACFHSSWIYFTEAFGLEILGYVEPRPGVPPTGRELASLVAVMKAKGVKVILREQYHSDRFANMVADKAGGKVVIMPASVESMREIKTYADLIESVVSLAADGLKAQQ